MNTLAAAVIAAGELVCQFGSGERQSLVAYEALTPESAEVLSSGRPGRRSVAVRPGAEYLHLVQAEGASVRLTTLTGCTRYRSRGGEAVCTRFAARHAWLFDAAASSDPDGAFRRQPSGAAAGACEPWRVD